MVMHDDEIRISADTVRRLILDQFPEWSAENVVRLRSAGTDNAIFRIGTARAARFRLRGSSPDAVDAEIQHEASAMREFAGISSISAPLPLAIGRPNDQYPFPWTVQSWVPGEVATPLGSAASEGLALEMAELVAAFRSAPIEGRRFSGSGRGGDLADSDQWMDTCLSKSADLLDVPRLATMWAQFRLLPRVQPDAMTHGDLIPSNILLRENQLVGVLDTGGFSAADPSLDLIPAWHLFDHDARAVFRAALGIELLEWQRGAAWAFQQAMGLVWYYRVSHPMMAQLGRCTLSRICNDAELLETLPHVRRATPG